VAFSRRGFLFLLGSATPGLWLAGHGLLTLEPGLVLALSGRCSFCGGRRDEVRGLAGRESGGAARICDGCVGLCVEICAEAGVLSPRAPSRARLDRGTTDALLAGEMHSQEAVLRRYLEGRRPALRVAYRCSFCDANGHEARKVISGKGVLICDRCTAEGAALVSHVLRT
jgi:hypothetical protein